MPKKQPRAKAAADHDALSRQGAGEYRTGDDRFAVRQADVGWFVVDLERTNEFGQELIHGPYATLKAAKGALPDARSAEAPRAPRRPRPSAKAGAPEPEPPKPKSWIDELKPAEAREVRRLIAVLEREGVEDAEDLVRRDRDGLLPAIATRLIERRLEALAGAGADDPKALLRHAAEVLSAEGAKSRDPLPGWVLVEVPAGEDAPKQRRIDLRR
ncbi:MAG TPA: hypothetical protein VFW95_12440 [Candidatus Limnocylindria bacterium]|nr:hypothetical protein [Candidatus Limnocylindria bacterium]